MKIIKKASALQNYLSNNANISKLRSSTTLIISSAPPPPPSSGTPKKTDQELKKFHSGLEQHIGQCHFFTGMQFNLKTISYGNNTLSGAYPTMQNINETLDLMKRTGASNVIGVGSGAAMDLAKACFYKNLDSNNGDEDGQLILNPSTLGATLASTSKGCLALCTDEEALLPVDMKINEGNVNATSVLVDEKAITLPSWIQTSPSQGRSSERSQVTTMLDSALASLVVALDAAHSLNDVREDDPLYERNQSLLQETVDSAMSCVKAVDDIMMEDDPNKITQGIQDLKQNALQALISSGQLMSFGDLGSNDDTIMRRNISLAFSSTLLPKYFPHASWCSFTASLLPGLCRTIDEYENSEDSSHLMEWVEKINANQNIIIPSLASFAEGAPETQSMVDKIEKNGEFVNCQDADTDYLATILMTSLNR